MWCAFEKSTFMSWETITTHILHLWKVIKLFSNVNFCKTSVNIWQTNKKKEESTNGKEKFICTMYTTQNIPMATTLYSNTISTLLNQKTFWHILYSMQTVLLNFTTNKFTYVYNSILCERYWWISFVFVLLISMCVTIGIKTELMNEIVLDVEIFLFLPVIRPFIYGWSAVLI